MACFKDKHLSSLSQLQMVIAGVVLRGSTPKPSRQININLAEGHEVGTPYIVAVGSFAMSACVTAIPRPPLLTAAGQGLSDVQWHGS